MSNKGKNSPFLLTILVFFNININAINSVFFYYAGTKTIAEKGV